MANIRTKKIGRLLLAAGAASLLISNASATQVSQHASQALQAMSNAEVDAQQQSLMKLDQTQQIMNSALTKILAKNQADGSISVESLQNQANKSNLNDKELNDELYLQLQSYVNTNSEIVEGILSFDCVIGQKGCIYKDRNSLAKGKMIPAAKNQLIKSLTVKPNKKPIVLAKVSKKKIQPQNNLAQTIKHQKSGVIKPSSKIINKNKVVQTKLAPKKITNLQSKAQINIKTTKKRDNALIRKQKELMKGVHNPIDEIENNLAKVVKNKVTDGQNSQDMAADLKPSSQTFNKIYESMNHYTKDKHHVDIHEESTKMNNGHEIHEEGTKASTGSIRKDQHTQGDQGTENVQHEQEVHVDGSSDNQIKENTEIMQQLDLDKMFKENTNETVVDSRPIDKTAVMTEEGRHHHHSKKPQVEIVLQQAQDLVNASKKKVNKDKKLDELIKKHVSCPKCKECPSLQCAVQNVSPLEELATHSNELSFMSAEDKPEEVRFQIMPQDLRDFVTKDVQVLNSERIIGYNTYNNILEQEQGMNKNLQVDSNSDFYNVTVNFIAKRQPKIVNGKQENSGPKELPIQVYENSIIEVEKQQIMHAQETADQLAEDESEPRIIMPRDLKIPKLQKDKSMHQILQESRVSQDNDVTNVLTQEQTEIQTTTEAEEQNGVAEIGQQKVAETLENLPIELNNAQIASQIQNLTPEEAMQLAQEAQSQTSSKPANAVNLMISEDSVSVPSGNSTQQVAQFASEGGLDVKEISSLESLSQESKSIEQSFTDYIVPDSEKNMVESIFDQKIETVKQNTTTTHAEVAAPVHNDTTTHAQVEAPVHNDTFNQTLSVKHPSNAEHFSFLSRVSLKAQQELADEQKGIRRPLSESKLTQKLYSQAKLEKDEDQVKQEAIPAQTETHQEIKTPNLTQQKSSEKVEDFSLEDDQNQEDEEEAKIDEITVDEEQLEEPRIQGQIMTAQKKRAPKAKVMSHLSKTIKKAEHLKKKLQQLQRENTSDNKKHNHNIKTKKEARTLREVFDEIQHMDSFMKKKKSKDSQTETEINHKLKHDIKFSNKFLKKKIEVNTDKPLSSLKNVSAKKMMAKKMAKMSKSKIKNPFGKLSKQPGKNQDKAGVMQKALKYQHKQQLHHDRIKQSIRSIFKGKHKLSSKDKVKLNDPTFRSKLFGPDDDIHIKDIIAKKDSLDVHKLFSGKTNEQKILKKMMLKKKQQEEESDDEAEENEKKKKKNKEIKKKLKVLKEKKQRLKLKALNKKAKKSDDDDDDNSQSLSEAGANSFSQKEIINMEENTLEKKIDIDLKVLTKLENDKHPDQPQITFKIVKEFDNQQQEEEETEDMSSQESTEQQALVQKQVPEVSNKAADEFVQANAQNILEIKEVIPINNETQQLSQTQLHQQVLKEMTDLQKQFVETAKEKEEIKNEEENAQSMKKMLEEKADSENARRQELMNKAQKMAQADLVAKHALRKATEQAAIDKEQNMLSFEKNLMDEQKVLAGKQKVLQNHKKEALKARQLVLKVQNEEIEVKGRLEKEEKIRAELDKKEQEKTKQALKKSDEIQKQHKQKMQKLIGQQIELQNKKKKILVEQESERKRLEEELMKVNKVKSDLLKVAEPESSEILDSSQNRNIADNLNLLNQQQIVIQQAIDKVKLAEEQGARKGLAEAEKLIKKQETQSLEQSEADMKHLQTKFESTSQKVGNIVQNFNKVHSDLQTLKSQYSTNSSSSGEEAQSEEDVQLANKLIMIEQSNIALKMHSKQRQMKQIVHSLDQIKEEIPDNTALQTEIQQTKKLGLQDLIMIDNQLNLPAH